MTPTQRPSLRIGLAYDFRTRPNSNVSVSQAYAAGLDQIRLVDQLGFDHVWFSEHRFLEDGHLPGFVPAAGAVAGATKHLRIGTDIALLPFYDPLRLAEDVAVLDQLSGGRMELGIGMGYAAHEFAAINMPVKNRVSHTEEGIQVLRGAWSDEPLTFHGKRYNYDNVPVHPKPIQPGGPPLWIAAMSTGGAMRAARFDTNLLPQGNRDVVLDPWRAELTATGRDPAGYRVGILRSFLVTDDKERDWPAIREAERYRMSVYARFFAETADTFTALNRDAAPIPQNWVVGTPDEVAAELQTYIDDFGVTDITGWGLPPGVDADILNRSHERFAHEVLPRLRAANQ
ncbi:MAG: alkanesulfonate monooxygenase SsuD [Candidatus Poriferisodalaceae bacterium]|jgi:alkanesulfonate monooxygenase SsuD/methylene tetrahydromethanopterin reductase-like flavin-dependent oxidoreductase (luciferase family)